MPVHLVSRPLILCRDLGAVHNFRLWLEVVISSLSNDRASAQRLYSAEQAAGEVLDSGPRDILAFGARGELRLCVRVPDNISVWWRHSLGPALERDVLDALSTGRPPQLLPNVRLLELSADDCQGILSGTQYRQDTFANGWSVDEHSVPHLISETGLSPISTSAFRPGPLGHQLVTYPADSSRRRHTTYPLDDPIPLDLNVEDVYLTAEGFARFKELYPKERAKRLGQEEFRIHPNRSEKLSRLDDAARLLWDECWEKGQRYPSKSVIQQRLGRPIVKGGCSFKNNLAEAGARIIALNRETQPQDFRTLRFETLIKAWEEFWKNADLGDGSTCPPNEMVRDWLIDEHLFPKTLASPAATLVRPENASRTRQPYTRQYEG